MGAGFQVTKQKNKEYPCLYEKYVYKPGEDKGRTVIIKLTGLNKNYGIISFEVISGDYPIKKGKMSLTVFPDYYRPLLIRSR